ncbi:MAG: hypothetical protein PHS80_02955 [Methanothrix sp.]|nr:hypothetical protein [Methanothrix sp.]MDD4447014.1 hypothetical protein [Methanothrix sp.]
MLASPRAPVPARAYGRTRLTTATSPSEATTRCGRWADGRGCRCPHKDRQAGLCASFVIFVRFVVWPVAAWLKLSSNNNRKSPLFPKAQPPEKATQPVTCPTWYESLPGKLSRPDDIAASPDGPARRQQPQARPKQRCDAGDGLTGRGCRWPRKNRQAGDWLRLCQKVSVSLRLCGLVCNYLNIIIY